MIRWITDRLATAAWDHAHRLTDLYPVDVRDLVDKGGNPAAAVKAKIDDAVHHLNAGEKVVICCDYGMSRSNAIAAGVLAVYQQVSIDDAIQQILQATGEQAIKIEVLSVVRSALAEERQSSAVDNSDPRILLTGGSGFIASYLLPALQAAFQVHPITSRDFNLATEVVNLDLLIKAQQINTVIHLANPRIYTTIESLGLTLTMLKNILDLCKENNLYLVFLSGWEIYSGYKTQALLANESLAPNPGGTYGYAKYLAERLIQEYTQKYPLRTLVLRSGPVYGIGADRPKFIWNFLAKATAQAEIKAHRYLNGYPKLDLLHVADLCRAILAAISCQTDGTLNIGTGIATSTTEIAEQMIQYTGSHSQIAHVEIADYTGNIVMDNSKARARLGWQPELTLAAGLKQLVEHHLAT